MFLLINEDSKEKIIFKDRDELLEFLSDPYTENYNYNESMDSSGDIPFLIYENGKEIDFESDLGITFDMLHAEYY